MNKCILLVEDDVRLLGFNIRKLQRKGFEILSAETLAEASEQLKKHTPDLIVLDVMLPDGNGVNFCKKLRKTLQVPVIFLSGKTQLDDRIAGLNSGGDYYMTKPYDYDEFVAVIESILRRSSTSTSISDTLTLGPLSFDLTAMQATLYGDDLQLSPKEYAILLLLVQNTGLSLSSEELYEKVWKQPASDDCRALWSQMSRLRKKLVDCDDLELHNDRIEGYSITLINP